MAPSLPSNYLQETYGVNPLDVIVAFEISHDPASRVGINGAVQNGNPFARPDFVMCLGSAATMTVLFLERPIKFGLVTVLSKMPSLVSYIVLRFCYAVSWITIGALSRALSYAEGNNIRSTRDGYCNDKILLVL